MQRGWCPSLYEPMATGDGLLVRVKPPAAGLTSAAARALAEAAERLGNGVVELTRRGNLQVRGLTQAGVASFAAAMVAAGLADPDPAAERRRIVLPASLAGDDTAVAPGTLALTAAIEELVPPGLPAKFCVAIDGGGVLSGAPAADVVLRFDGACLWLNNEPCASLAAMRQRLDDAVGSVRGAILPARAPGSAIGFHPYAGTQHGAFGIGPPFGQTDPDGLRELADIADRFSGGAIRPSPWRAMLLGRVAARDVPALRDAAAGWITDPADPRLGFTACVGSPACERATVPARADAARAAASGVPGSLHLSGCAKGCAYQGGPVLVGAAGRYSRVEAWRPGAAPTPQGLSLAAALRCGGVT